MEPKLEQPEPPDDRIRRLDPEDFPVEIVAIRSDTDQPIWGVTILQPPDSDLIPVYIPGMAHWYGVPVLIATTFWGQPTYITGPYGSKDMDDDA